MFVYFLPLFCWMSPCLPSPAVIKEVTSGQDQGIFDLTHYWLAEEKKSELATIPLRLNQGTRRISKRFATSLRLQGSGLLRDGKLVQYTGLCSGRLPKKGGIACLKGRLVNQRRYPLGRGASGMPLVPFRSLAVDSRRITLGSRIYIPSLKRWFRSRGVKHDGCFLADDEGGRIRQVRLDLFVGTRRLFRLTVGRLPRFVRLYLQHPRCKGRIRPLRLRKRRRLRRRRR